MGTVRLALEVVAWLAWELVLAPALCIIALATPVVAFFALAYLIGLLVD